MHVYDMKKHIDSNTICLVGSCPEYPFGNCDDLEAIGQLGLEMGIPVHADCCFGSFVIPFVEEAGFKGRPHNFTVPGITSISCDTHKYGMGPKGLSVVMFKNQYYRRPSIFSTNEWCGGMYPSNTIAGSRPGNVIAGNWAAMLRYGRDGYG